ncbi:MAG TPA: hypothetical protein VNG12_09205, partial [Acidimicrobiales bacterium]|nr:hypothetical protein [Acidimicrobiales bacterium]
MTIAKRHIPRRWLLAALGGAIIGMFAVGQAIAVHDQGFQLEGNATAADLTFGAATSGPATHPAGSLSGVFAGPCDWDSLFTVSGTPAPGNAEGTVTGAQSPLPCNFTAVDFEKDFQNNGTTFLTADSTTFTLGSKDTLDVSGWTCKYSNNVNSKVDIMNGFAAVMQPSPSGDTNFYYGLEKAVNNGDNNVGLWLFQDRNVGCSSANGTTGFSGVHTNGDLLIVSAFTNGGGVSNIAVYAWENGLLVQQGPTGIDCLATSGGDNTCSTVNEKTISMPWLTADNGVINAPHPSPNFFEGGIDLSKYPAFSGTCFNRYLLDTRSSQSTTATLFDYVQGSVSRCKPDLSIVKTPATGTHDVGASFDWNLHVANNGNGDATGATVTDAVPAGLTVNS